MSSNPNKTLLLGVGGIMIVGAIGGGGYLLYKNSKQKPDPKPTPSKTSPYDKFTSMSVDADVSSSHYSSSLHAPSSHSSLGSNGTVGQSISVCEQNCSKDDKCTAFSINSKTGECMTTTKDPYDHYKETSDEWALYIKRSDADEPSFWSDWSPISCPMGCVKTPITRTRICKGKRCPGKSETTCGNPVCDKFEEYPAGYVLSPDPKNVIPIQVHTETKSECEDQCLKDPNCKALYWGKPRDSGHKNCSMASDSSYKVEGLLWKGEQYSSSDLSIRIPGVGNGSWGEMPLKTSCKCGVSKLDRSCKSGSDCSVGPKYLECGSASACAYDTFPHMYVN